MHAQAGNLKDVLDDERPGQEVGQQRAGVRHHRQNRERKSVLQQQRILTESFSSSGDDEFGFHNIEHSLAQQPGDPAGKIQTERNHGQNGVPRRAPQRDRQ